MLSQRLDHLFSMQELARGHVPLPLVAQVHIENAM